MLNNAASFAAAYQIGRTEAGAATNLLTAVSESTREQLMELVRCGFNFIPYWFGFSQMYYSYTHVPFYTCRIFGQPKFLLQDGLAAGIFNSDYNGGTGVFHQWQKLLGNSQDLVDTMIKRMRLDFESLNAKMRKPWNQVTLDSFLSKPGINIET